MTDPHIVSVTNKFPRQGGIHDNGLTEAVVEINIGHGPQGNRVSTIRLTADEAALFQTKVAIAVMRAKGNGGLL